MSGKETGFVNIHGKTYKTVGKRVDEFRSKFGEKYALTTELVENDAERVVIRALIANEDGRIIATGFAEERRNSSMINKTSALENCETSAIGRALANFGFGGDEYASADEVANAIAQQNAPRPKKATPPENKWESYLVDYHEIQERLDAIDNDAELAEYSKELGVKHPKLTETQKKTIGEKFNRKREELKQQ